MAASITPGVDFDTTVTLTMTSLHQLVDDATIADIAKTEIDTNARIISVSGSAPSSGLQDGDYWWDSTLKVFRVRRSGFYDGSPIDYTGINFWVDHVAKGLVLSGTVTARHIQPQMTANIVKTFGVATATISSGSTGWVRSHGMASVSVTGGCNRGAILVAAGQTGMAVQYDAYYTDLTLPLGISIGFATATLVGSGLVTAYLW